MQAYDHFKMKQLTENPVHTASQNVHRVNDAFVDDLNNKRNLQVFIPPGYYEDSITYPVIYMLDGESLFNDLTAGGYEWQVDEQIEKTIDTGGPPAIVIGIESNEHRSKEYKPYRSGRDSEEEIYGKAFARFIAHTLKPMIDSLYRTKTDPANTIIGGCSLGGLLAYYTLMEHEDIFGKALVFSPSFWVSEEIFSIHQEKNISDKKLFLSVGSGEGNMVGLSSRCYKNLKEAGMTKDQINYVKQRGKRHDHRTWRAAFKIAYPWILES